MGVESILLTFAYPIEYLYDPQGRVGTSKTWQSYAADTGISVTTWSYDSQTGLLLSKRYADNTGPDYTYTTGGKLLTRQWWRTVTGGARLIATYTYNNAGEQSGVSYNDGLTPNETYGIDRRSRRR